MYPIKYYMFIRPIDVLKTVFILQLRSFGELVNLTFQNRGFEEVQSICDCSSMSYSV